MSHDEALFRVWIESVRDFAIFMVAPDGAVSSWNVGAERIFGYREDEILGQSFPASSRPRTRPAASPRRRCRRPGQRSMGGTIVGSSARTAPVSGPAGC